MPDASVRDYYRNLSDDGLIEAFVCGEHAYQPESWDVLCQEMANRGLTSPQAPLPPMDDDGLTETPGEKELEEALRAARTTTNRGAFLFYGGIIASILLYVAGPAGGTFAMAWLPVLAGLYRMMDGRKREARLMAMANSRRKTLEVEARSGLR